MHEHQWDPIEAVRSADWERILPGLLAYAAWLLRPLGSTTSTESLGGAAEDLVQEAVMRVLQGSRRYHGSGPPDLEYLLRGAMKSIASDRKKQAAKRAQIGEFNDDETGGNEDDWLETGEFQDERLKHIEEVIDQDTELETLYLTILDGNLMPTEIAAATGWSSAKASVVKKRMQRALLRKNEEQT